MIRSLVCLALLLSSLQSVRAEDKPDVPPGPPPAPQVAREFRAAWIATVANIDWPSKPGLDAREQRRELTELMELAAKLKLNAVVFQVRPACDALYRSDLEPWSEFLTGEQGKSPGYDPLEFACEEGRRLGLEVHAWFNPYRAVPKAGKGVLAKNHIANEHPEMVRDYGKQKWLDPGDPEAVAHSLRVVLDVVHRYDIDAVHFDDYFYPYPITEENEEGKKVEVDFPDEPSWKQYCEQTPEAERLSRDDWRRDNVNRFIQKVAEGVRKTKPHVRFGVSPFGIWRPGHPKSIQGFDPYVKLYADAKLWLEEGWVDYFAPQLYWPIDQKPQSFTTLLNWWSQQNPKERHLWPGLYTSKAFVGNPPWEPSELINQIVTSREQQGTGGHIHFSIKALRDNSNGVTEALADSVYVEPALVPATPWLAGDAPVPGAPELKKVSGNKCRLSPTGETEPRWWVVHTLHHETWTTDVVPGAERTYKAKRNDDRLQPLKIVVSAVDQLGREGERTELELRKPR